MPLVGELWNSGGTPNVWKVRWVNARENTVGVERVSDGERSDVWDAGHVYCWPIGALTNIGKRIN